MFSKIKKPKLPKVPKLPKTPKPKASKTDKKVLSVLSKYRFNIVILALLLLALVFINFLIQEFLVVVVSIILYLSVLSLIIIKSYSAQKSIKTRENRKNTPIKELVLIEEDGEEVLSWEIAGLPSLIIGKNGEKEGVDVDLSESVYANLISREHAVMNFDGKEWFVEDIGSLNGTGVKSAETGQTTKLLEGTRFPVYIGDIILIANTRLLLK